MLESLGTASLSWLLGIVKIGCDLLLFGNSMTIDILNQLPP